MMLSQIKGQIQTTTILKQVLLSGSKGRTYIFTGPTGVGKMTTALAFARELIGADPTNHPDCSFYRNDSFILKSKFFLKHLSVAVWLEKISDYFSMWAARVSRSVAMGELKKNQLDFIQGLQESLHNKSLVEFLQNKKNSEIVLELSEELESKKKIPVSYIRSIIEDHQQKPSGNFRVSIIGDFETSSIESQNAILKLLEEPPATSVLILTTSNLQALLATITSRALVIPFKPLSTGVISDLFYINNAAYHSTLDLMKDEIYQYTQKKKDHVLTFFSRIAPQVQHNHELFTFIDEMEQDNNQEFCLNFLSEMLTFFRNMIYMAYSGDQSNAIDQFLDGEYQTLGLKILSKVKPADIEAWVERISKLQAIIKKGNVKSKMVLPLLLVDISRWYQLSLN